MQRGDAAWATKQPLSLECVSTAFVKMTHLLYDPVVCWSHTLNE